MTKRYNIYIYIYKQNKQNKKLRVCDNEKERYILLVRIVEFKINFMSLMQLFFNLREQLQFHVTQTSLVSRSRSVAIEREYYTAIRLSTYFPYP